MVAQTLAILHGPLGSLHLASSLYHLGGAISIKSTEFSAPTNAFYIFLYFYRFCLFI